MRISKNLIFIFILFLMSSVLTSGVSEYTLKAACLYNFAKFVTWPAQSFTTPASPLVIGVVGEDPFGKILDDTVADKTIGGHPIKVKRFDGFENSQASQIKKCHILFVCYSEKDKTGEILKALQGASVLTVSEIGNFLVRGGDLLFDQEGSKVALQINADAAKDAGLEISSKLLQVCKIYKSE